MKGQPAPDFTVPDMEGNEVAFSSIYPGFKVTMIDFWASWCGPCRNFNPALVEIYNEYHDKGFEIVGVSMDNDKESWLQAIKDDGLTWIQLSDLAYWNTKPRNSTMFPIFLRMSLLTEKARSLLPNLTRKV